MRLIRDLGSGKNSFRIPDPGGKKAPYPGHRIRSTGEHISVILLIVVVNTLPGTGTLRKTVNDLPVATFMYCNLQYCVPVMIL
jgi:hypothetical protein